MPTIANSTFLDLTSYGTTTATTVEAAYSVSGRPASQDINVAFILPRANDPSALLSSNWATRQTTLQELRDNGTLWSTYGATASDYTNARSILSGHGTIIGSPTGATDGYVTSQEFAHHLGDADAQRIRIAVRHQAYQAGDLYYWNGNLSVPNGLNVAGLWFDTAPWFGTPPAASDLSGGARAVVHEGPQSIGNYLSTTFQMSNYFPGAIARDFYNFPLAGKDVPTTTVGPDRAGHRRCHAERQPDLPAGPERLPAGRRRRDAGRVLCRRQRRRPELRHRQQRRAIARCRRHRLGRARQQDRALFRLRLQRARRMPTCSPPTRRRSGTR